VTDISASGIAWAPRAREILRRPLAMRASDRWMLRTVALIGRRQLRSVQGLEHVSPANDPFILAMNHSIRREAVLVPALLILYRDGKLIHFLSDWNFRLIPGLGFFLKRAGTIIVMSKSARPRFLNVLKPLFRQSLPSIERARQHLNAGRSVGVFPEGTINRDPHRLLPARLGMARLSLMTGVPVVPVGIRFPQAGSVAALDERAVMDVHIGAPMAPPGRVERASLAETRGWSATIMDEIGRLSGKAWQSTTVEGEHAS